MKNLIKTILILLLVLSGEDYTYPQDEIELNGKITARYAFEQLMVQLSSVIYNDHYLFSPHDDSLKIIKLVHRYGGYPGDFNDSTLFRLPKMKIIAKADPACDETYKEFIENARVYSEHYAGKDADPLVVYDEKSMKNMDNTTLLKCYVLSGFDYKIIGIKWRIRGLWKRFFRCFHAPGFMEP